MDETALRAWLAQIGEIDLACIAEVLGLCQQDAVALEYFLRQAALNSVRSDNFVR